MANIIRAGGGGGDIVSEAWVVGDNVGPTGCLVNADSYRLAAYGAYTPWSLSSGTGNVSFKLNSGYTKLHCLIAIACQPSNCNVDSFNGAKLTYKKISGKVFECWFTDITADTFDITFSFPAPAAVRAYMTTVFDD